MRTTSRDPQKIPNEIHEPTRESLKDKPFVGLWRDRKDMQDSSEWVRTTRQLEWTRR